MQQALCNGTVSVRLSVPSISRCSSVRRVCCCGPGGRAGDIDRLLQEHGRSSAATASSVTILADVGSWTQTCCIHRKCQRSAGAECWCMIRQQLPANAGPCYSSEQEYYSFQQNRIFRVNTGPSTANAPKCRPVFHQIFYIKTGDLFDCCCSFSWFPVWIRTS